MGAGEANLKIGQEVKKGRSQAGWHLQSWAKALCARPSGKDD